MNWFVDWTNKAKRDLKALDRQMKDRIDAYLEKAAKSKNPRTDAKRLKGNYAGKSAYKVGGYRVIVKFNDAEKIIKVVEVDPRGRAYRNKNIHRISEDSADWNPADDGADSD